ncbi:DUF1045 domain-containing protein [Pelagibius sp. Alg239-R121]|uniref:DUF1045 domain-containing protein n=1 Tax=Pelagibius sp. Alg239-R121 TaxID=2993448 RepID=UPI0024A63BAD|nr:DUF1045 domain-containing protein [Pelagibius sp. Alg239-R121]
MTARYAIYYTPERSSDLARFANAWLNDEPGATVFGDEVPWSGLIDPDHRRSMTSAPRTYGFHATLKPPFFLAEDMELTALEMALADFAAERPRVVLPPMELVILGDFLALRTSESTSDLDALAGDAVRRLDAFRKPSTDEELAIRRGAGLTERQEDLLMKWGYPYVLEEFRFHMTLSNRLDETGQSRLLSILKPILEPLVEKPLTIEAISLCEQPEAGARFNERGRFPLLG